MATKKTKTKSTSPNWMTMKFADFVAQASQLGWEVHVQLSPRRPFTKKTKKD